MLIMMNLKCSNDEQFYERFKRWIKMIDLLNYFKTKLMDQTTDLTLWFVKKVFWLLRNEFIRMTIKITIIKMYKESFDVFDPKKDVFQPKYDSKWW